MNNLSALTSFGNIYNSITQSTLQKVGSVFADIFRRTAELFERLPESLQFLLTSAFYLALVGMILSLVTAIIRNCKQWKPDPDSTLMLSYLCGTGTYQRRLIYKSARALLCDRRWSWISAAGLAFRLGNLKSSSRLVLFVLSLVYIPLSVIGAVEMALRIVLGHCIFFCLNLAYAAVLLVLGAVARLLIVPLRLLDRILRTSQHCPYCYSHFSLPDFKCPRCGKTHSRLIPSRHGLLVAKCKCGQFIPCSVISGRSRLTGVCADSSCGKILVAPNAKQTFIQIIGEGACGKTAYSAALQHQYLAKSASAHGYTVSGAPRVKSEALEYSYQNGTTTGSVTSETGFFSFIHSKKGIAKHSLCFYDNPDEMLLCEVSGKSPLDFAFTDGIMILIDPLSESTVRNEAIRRGELSRTSRTPNGKSEELVVSFINKFSEISGRSAKKMSDIPVAVLITKCDTSAVKERVGISKIKSEFKKTPELYNGSLSVARDSICRDYLRELGFSNTVNNLESVFSNVAYFPTSAIGHTPRSSAPFEPFGILGPIMWLTKKRSPAVYRILKSTSKNKSATMRHGEV